MPVCRTILCNWLSTKASNKGRCPYVPPETRMYPLFWGSTLRFGSMGPTTTPLSSFFCSSQCRAVIAEIYCNRCADLEGFTKRTGLSMLTMETLRIQASIAGGTQKLLPALTTTSNFPRSWLQVSTKALISRTANTWLGVLGSRAFNKNPTFPNLLSLLALNESPWGTRKFKDAFW